MSYPGNNGRPTTPAGSPKITLQGRNPDGTMHRVKVELPFTSQDLFTLSRGPDMRPLQFQGEILGEVEKDAVRSGLYAPPSFHRAAIYKTRGGSFVSEFSTIDSDGERTGKADVFGTLDEACDWFRPGPLTTDLLKQLGRWGPEIIA